MNSLCGAGEKCCRYRCRIQAGRTPKKRIHRQEYDSPFGDGRRFRPGSVGPFVESCDHRSSSQFRQREGRRRCRLESFAEANNRLVKLQAANKRLAEEYGISSTAVFCQSRDRWGYYRNTWWLSRRHGPVQRNKFQAEDDWLALEQSKTLASYARVSSITTSTMRRRPNSTNSIC